jgi:hypothetical protein
MKSEGGTLNGRNEDLASGEKENDECRTRNDESVSKPGFPLLSVTVHSHLHHSSFIIHHFF